MRILAPLETHSLDVLPHKGMRTFLTMAVFVVLLSGCVCRERANDVAKPRDPYRVDVREEQRRLRNDPQGTVKGYITALDDVTRMPTSNDRMRMTIATMGRLKEAGKVAVPQILRYAKESTNNVARVIAISVLMDIGDETICEQLREDVTATANPLPPRAKGHAYEVLGKWGGKKYVGFLREELSHAKDKDEQWCLVAALSRMGDPSGTEFLVRAVESGSSSEKEMGTMFLKMIYSRDFGQDAHKWREWIEKK